MKRLILFKYYNLLLTDIYNRTLKKNGFTPLGVCWNSTKSQYNRFQILLKLLGKFSFQHSIKLADVGCGYGEFLVFLRKNRIHYSYEGYDINKKMIEFCKKKFQKDYFYINSQPLNSCDVSVMSGTYNYAVTDDLNLWEEYIINNLLKCFKKSNLGILFNLQFNTHRLIKNNIYYTESSFMMRLLKKHFNYVEKYISAKSKNDIFFIIYKN